ncbi:MAG TPA: phosphodiester glycosidase family protein [Gemmatimonadales bacterium]|nr:phosphodiester glycosidase family protein [Gemmatimonadales bacterium]
MLRSILAGGALALLATVAPATLRVELGGSWRTWWQADSAPSEWLAPLDDITSAIEWEERGHGIEWGTLRLSGAGEARRVKAIIVRVDPSLVTFRLEGEPARTGPPHQWTVDDTPGDALLSLNAGQFGPARPWGWVVRDGMERQSPGTGPLAPALVVDTTGRLRFVPADSIGAVRGSGTVVEAFQSYPTLLDGNGQIPRPLREPGLGVDLNHRDSRLAVGETRDGHLLFVLTRFNALGGLLDHLPFGLTTPEMAALMGALGACRAALLDGGVSSQMVIQLGAERHEWSGMRRVPLGLIGIARN